MDEDRGIALLELVAKHRKSGWVALGAGVLCRAIGYGQAIPGALPFSSDGGSWLSRLWFPATLLEAGLVLLILGSALVLLSVYFEFVALSRRQ